MNIIELAEQAGFGIDEIPGVSQRYVIQPLHWKVDDELTRFATLVRNAALEEAARATAPHSDVIVAARAIRELKEQQT